MQGLLETPRGSSGASAENLLRLSCLRGSCITDLSLLVGNCQSEKAVHRTAFWHWVCEGGIKSPGHWEEVVPRRWWCVGCHRRRGNGGVSADRILGTELCCVARDLSGLRDGGGKGLVFVVSHCALGQFVLSFQFCSKLMEGDKTASV